ncbi:MAG: squalene--hopene cyclase [Planctomycetota bacterium]
MSQQVAGSAPPVLEGTPEGQRARFDRALDGIRSHLLDLQHEDGHWCARLEGGSITESEYILMQWILGNEDDEALPRIADSLRHIQCSDGGEWDGGWLLFPGGPADISGTVQAYFALKLMGDDTEAPHMRRARDLILRMGGAEKVNTFTRFYFACLGQVPFSACPTIPPELVWLPRWFPLNLYNMSAWTRTMVLPLGLVTTLRPRRELSESQGISELYIDRAAASRLSQESAFPLPPNWSKLFLLADRLLKLYHAIPLKPFRKSAIRAAEKWIVEHHESSEGLGAIFPPMVYSLVVFKCLGYPDDHPLVVKCHKDLRDFFLHEPEGIRVQPCFSPGWDTGIALHAFAEGVLEPTDDEAIRGTDWLLRHEIRVKSDWARAVPDVEPGAWAFEYANPHYPDTDDSAMAIAALHRLGGERATPAIERGRAWLLAMQNDDGGWAAFDRTMDRPILEEVPFADHNAMQDPSCPDITGRVLEALGHTGLRASDPEGRAAIEYLKKDQDPSGAWWGRWGVNYVYGSWQVLVGLAAIGEDMRSDYTRRSADWLKSVQKADGSFGETPDTYRDPSLKGTGESTASQTAWGAMGMMSVYGPNDPDVLRALEWLAETQAEDGGWDEPWWTGTGFPNVYYLRYHYYRLYFPMMALARQKRLAESA